MNDFWINVSYSPPHNPRQKNKEIKSAKNEINAFKSQQVQFKKSQKLLPFHRTDFRTFQYSNSIAGSVHNRFTVKQTYYEHDYVPRY